MEENVVSSQLLRVGEPEGPDLLPGQMIKLALDDVMFPCVASAWVSATADATFLIMKNARSKPSLTVYVSPIGALPHLFTDIVRVGLQDSGGSVTWDPPCCVPEER